MNVHAYYNDRVNPATAARLLDLNRRFYADHGRDFSATRLRLQPGVKRLLDRLTGGESILDLGSGNGELARSLSSRGHRGSYLGLDFSPTLLSEAVASSFSFPVSFASVDLSRPFWDDIIIGTSAVQPAAPEPPFDLVTCFAVLHHFPGASLRSGILCTARDLLASDGALMLSNWRFTESPRMRDRVQHWSALDLAPEDVDPDDYLLDWRRGGSALRYVHQFDEPELAALAAETGFTVAETFYSDGADRKSSLYQVWKIARG